MGPFVEGRRWDESTVDFTSDVSSVVAQFVFFDDLESGEQQTVSGGLFLHGGAALLVDMLCEWFFLR
jgi:hypothetical protein